MPPKPIKFSIRASTLADAITKYVWNFEIYCEKDTTTYEEDAYTSSDGHLIQTGSDHEDVEHNKPRKGVGLQGRNVVKDLMKDLCGRRHILMTDNFFTSIPLFLDLKKSGTIATGTLCSNRKYLPKSIFAKSLTKNQPFGWIEWCMHGSKKICCAVWKDKKRVLLLSTHREPISPPDVEQC